MNPLVCFHRQQIADDDLCFVFIWQNLPRRSKHWIYKLLMHKTFNELFVVRTLKQWILDKVLISDGNWEKQTRKRPNKRVTYGNHFLSDRVMMMRREGHTPYSGLPTILRILYEANHTSPFTLRITRYPPSPLTNTQTCK